MIYAKDWNDEPAGFSSDQIRHPTIPPGPGSCSDYGSTMTTVDDSSAVLRQLLLFHAFRPQ